MRIGIDIDDTMTDIKDKLTVAALEYAIKLGKNVTYDGGKINDIYNNGNVYQRLFGFNYDELKYFLKDIQESITDNALPREGCVKIIKKLKKEGHEIIVITARDSEFHDNPYKQSKVWLDKNNILYDKLIVNARDKGMVCKSEKIDILIDDNLNNCLSVLKENIKAIRFSSNKSNDVINCDNWCLIYEIIKRLSI